MPFYIHRQAIAVMQTGFVVFGMPHLSLAWWTTVPRRSARDQAGPATGIRMAVAGPARPGPGADSWRWSLPRRAAKGDAYEVLLDAAMTGKMTRFTRQDSVEETWRIMQPLLDSPPPVQTYQPGTWGPIGANED